MKETGEAPAGAEADIKEGDALQLPFADGEFDRIVAAEILEPINEDVRATEELVRVLRPGGSLALSLPRWLPEVINWQLSSDYHNAADIGRASCGERVSHVWHNQVVDGALI